MRLLRSCSPDDKDGGPCELDGNGYSVRARVVAVLGAVVHDRSNEKTYLVSPSSLRLKTLTERDRKLVRSNDGASNPLRRSFRLIHGDCRISQEEAEQPTYSEQTRDQHPTQQRSDRR